MIPSSNDDVSSDEEIDDASDCVQTVRLEQMLHVENFQNSDIVAKNPEITRVNLDVSTMLTLVSNLSNGFDQFHYGVPVLDDQANRERNERVLPKLERFLENKTLLACEEAVCKFEKIVKIIGGEKEKQRARKLMSNLTVVPNNPSARTLSLITSSKLNKRAKVGCYYVDRLFSNIDLVLLLSQTVFGTGDHERAITVTANIGFVRAALQNGVRYSVFEHEPRALTELKETSGCARQ